jgi:hypothetical protein
MHMVTLLRAPASIERASAVLAARQGISPYEARTRLAGEFPRVVAVFADPDAAMAQCRGLIADGIYASVLDGDTVEHDEDRDIAASLSFGDRQLEATMRDGRVRAIAYNEVALLIHGARTAVRTSTEERTVKTFSAGRAILTGGLSMRTSKTVTTTKSTEVRENFLYVREDSGAGSLAIYERGMNYSFLGDSRAASSMANFTTVLTWLMNRCPDAHFDSRMTRAGGFGLVPMCPTSMDPAAWKSDVAAALLALRYDA